MSASKAAARGVLGAVTVAALLSGCGCTISDAHDDSVTHNMRCVSAHDEYDSGDAVHTLCDSWSPAPETAEEQTK